MENRQIRIAQIMGKWLGGGVESVVMNYYRNIDKNKIQFDFICDEDSTNIPYNEIIQMGGKVILIPPYQKIFKYQKELKKVLKKGNYKIVHSHINTLSVFSLLAAKRAGVPIRIAHSHSTIINNKAEWKKSIFKNILKNFSKLFANYYFCCSSYAGISQFGKKLFYSGEVYQLNNAIELNKFKYNEMVSIEERKKLKINDDALVIGHIGRFVPTKNHTFIIDIFNEIHKNNPNSILLLAGQGPLIEEIKMKVIQLKLEENVRFLGQVKDTSELYQAFNVFILPSFYEGLPVVGIEAQAAGILCYFSDTVTKETQILDSTAFMSLSNSAKEWANSILSDIQVFKKKDTSEEMSKHGFNIKNEVEKLEKKYIELFDRMK